VRKRWSPDPASVNWVATGHVGCRRLNYSLRGAGTGVSVATKPCPSRPAAATTFVTDDCAARRCYARAKLGAVGLGACLSPLTSRRLPVQESAGPLAPRPPLCRSCSAAVEQAEAVRLVMPAVRTAASGLSLSRQTCRHQCWSGTWHIRKDLKTVSGDRRRYIKIFFPPAFSILELISLEK
jgi:hypothetical protein